MLTNAGDVIWTELIASAQLGSVVGLCEDCELSIGLSRLAPLLGGLSP